MLVTLNDSEIAEFQDFRIALLIFEYSTNGSSGTSQSYAQHRHHGPHRCRQDDHDRAHPVLYRHHLQDRRGARRHRDDGLDGAGAGARDHHHVGGDDVLLARSPHQHHRHPGPRGLHGRGGALAARARRRGRGVRLGGRRRAAVRDGVAPGRQVPRAAHLLREQDGPHRRQLRSHGRSDQDAPAGQPLRPPVPDRHRGQVPRRRRRGHA